MAVGTVIIKVETKAKDVFFIHGWEASIMSVVKEHLGYGIMIGLVTAFAIKKK